MNELFKPTICSKGSCYSCGSSSIPLYKKHLNHLGWKALWEHILKYRDFYEDRLKEGYNPKVLWYIDSNKNYIRLSEALEEKNLTEVTKILVIERL